MPSNLLSKQHPLVYLITSGTTTDQTTSVTEDFSHILQLIRAAVVAGIDLVQIREKRLTARVLFELSRSAAEVVRGSGTKLLVNDRADIAAAAGADGVHLATTSLPTQVIRRTFGDGFLIGASTHSIAEVNVAREQGADFVVFGPVFETESKSEYGAAKGIEELSKLTATLASFPVLALGGVTERNAADCVNAGARGIAAISMLQEPSRLEDLTQKIHSIALRTER
jgi:thiamine-phosphate pyrophosphorylase